MPMKEGIKETFNGSFIWSLMEEKEHFTRMDGGVGSGWVFYSR